MPVRHYVLTLDGTAQKLSASGITDPVKHLAIQPDTGNANIIRVGSTADVVSSSSYGFRLEAPVTGVPPAPYVFEFPSGTISLADISVLGTLNEKLRILAVTP